MRRLPTRPSGRTPINHVRHGVGEPLVLLHGIGHRWQAWQPVLDRLAVHHEVVALDLPGFGDSPVPPAGLPRDMPGSIAALGEFLAAEGLDRPHVAGYSLGGAISLELAAAGQASSATVFSPAGFYTEAERLRALAILRTMRASTFLPQPLIRQTMRIAMLRARCFAPLLAHPGRLDTQRAIGDALALRRGAGFAHVARVGRGYRFEGQPQVPVTVAWGAKDQVLRPHQAERARHRLPQANHVPLADCGHVPMSDDPELVATLILQTTGALQAADHPGAP